MAGPVACGVVARVKQLTEPGVAPGAGDVEAVMLASRALVAVAAKSLAPVEDVVTAPQWRLLVVVSCQGTATLNEVAQALGVHPSTATRVCDQLVAAGLLLRQEDSQDRRYVALSLTRKGQRLVDKVTAARSADIEKILNRLEGPSRKRLVTALREFATAAGEIEVDRLWDLSLGSPGS